MTREQKIHNFLSEVFLITNDQSVNQNLHSEKKRTFLYEYMGEGRHFKLEELDDILMNRLQKNKDENKFIYLIQSYRRLENHLYVKSNMQMLNLIGDNVAEIKEQIVSYFNTLLVAPESFDINNDRMEVILDNEGGMNQQDMFMAMMGGAGAGAFGGFAEKLQSNK